MIHRFSLSLPQYREVADLLDADDFDIDAPPMTPGVTVVAHNSEAAEVFRYIMNELIKQRPELFALGYRP